MIEGINEFLSWMAERKVHQSEWILGLAVPTMQKLIFTTRVTDCWGCEAGGLRWLLCHLAALA